MNITSGFNKNMFSTTTSNVFQETVNTTNANQDILINNLANLIGQKQNIIGDESLPQIKVAGLTTLLSNKQPLIPDEGLPKNKITGLTTDLAAKQPLIADGGLSQTKITGLSDSLNSKQDVISDGSLSQSKISGLTNSLNSKQDVITDGSLSQSKIAGLTNSLNSKQDVIMNESLAQSKITGLTTALAGKQPLIADNSLPISKIEGLNDALNGKITSNQCWSYSQEAYRYTKNNLVYLQAPLIGTATTSSGNSNVTANQLSKVCYINFNNDGNNVDGATSKFLTSVLTCSIEFNYSLIVSGPLNSSSITKETTGLVSSATSSNLSPSVISSGTNNLNNFCNNVYKISILNDTSTLNVKSLWQSLKTYTGATTTSLLHTPVLFSNTYNGTGTGSIYYYYPIQFEYVSTSKIKVIVGFPSFENSPKETGWISSLLCNIRVVSANGTTYATDGLIGDNNCFLSLT